MKKWIFGIGILLVIFVAGIYIFVPGKLTITQVTPVRCSPNGTHRVLADTSKWKLWWPRGEYSFTPQEVLPQGIDVLVHLENNSLPSRIVVMPIERDSVTLVWQCAYPGSNNPFKRVSSYNQALGLKENFDSILSQLKTYLEDPVNVYGYSITQTSTKDTMLVAVRDSSIGEPGVPQVYKLVNQLKEYAIQNGALQTGYPMLNITPLGNNKFQFMVAVPVNKELPAKNKFFARRMVPGNFLMMEAKGGLKTIDDARAQLQQYAIDHQRTSMAIPFQVMVTDRQQEQDTTKWVTKIYYPVM